MYEVLKTLFSMYLSTNSNNTENLQVLLHSSHKMQKSAALLIRFYLIWRKRSEFICSGHHTSHTGGPRGSVGDEAAGYQIVSHSLISSPCLNFPYSKRWRACVLGAVWLSVHSVCCLVTLGGITATLSPQSGFGQHTSGVSEGNRAGAPHRRSSHHLSPPLCLLLFYAGTDLVLAPY